MLPSFLYLYTQWEKVLCTKTRDIAVQNGNYHWPSTTPHETYLGLYDLQKTMVPMIYSVVGWYLADRVKYASSVPVVMPVVMNWEAAVTFSVPDNDFVKVESMFALSKSENRSEDNRHEPMGRHHKSRCHQNHMKAGQVFHTNSCYL